MKTEIPLKLKQRNLIISQDKTEEYCINKNDDSWKSCKYLGSYLDTEKDITKRKQLSMMAYQKYKLKLESNKISLNVRARLFNVYVTSIFMYNSELWTLTKKLENEIDVFQRRLLKKMLKIKYPNIISNVRLYEKMKEIAWSKKIRTRRLKWTGHLLRLDENTPAYKSFKESNNTFKIYKNTNKKTWKKVINEDLKSIGLDLSLDSEDIKGLADDREWWMEMVVKKSELCSNIERGLLQW